MQQHAEVCRRACSRKGRRELQADALGLVGSYDQRLLWKMVPCRFASAAVFLLFCTEIVGFPVGQGPGSAPGCGYKVRKLRGSFGTGVVTEDAHKAKERTITFMFACSDDDGSLLVCSRPWDIDMLLNFHHISITFMERSPFLGIINLVTVTAGPNVLPCRRK